jgi:phosphatidylserine/phosphatidylglycerophosphate/cardiolipin synthase-like enzyme
MTRNLLMHRVRWSGMSLIVFALAGRAVWAQSPLPLLPIEIHFSPNGDCTATILRELAAAKSSVLVQAYWFTSVPIAKGLADAYKREVKVQVILDQSRVEKHRTEADFLVQNGVPTLIDGKHVTAHNKVIVIDGEVVITGSFNFTGQSEDENAENMLVIRDKTIAEKYVANWKAHAEHSPAMRPAKPK